MNQLKIILVKSLFLIFVFLVNGQTSETDSLKALLRPEDVDSTQIEINYRISQLYQNSNFDSSVFYAEKAYQMAKKAGYTSDLVKYRRQIAAGLRSRGEYNKALELFLLNLKEAKQSGDSVILQQAHQDLGSVYINLAEFEKATTHLVESAELSRVKGDFDSQARSYGNLGMTFLSHNEFDKAGTYMQKSLEIYQSIDNHVQVSATYLKIGRIYIAQKEFEKALEFNLLALEVASTTEHKNLQSIVYSELAATYLDLKHLEPAREYAEISLALKREINSKRGIAASLHTLGGIELESGNYRKALDYLLESLELLQEMGAKEQVMTGLKIISRAYREVGNYEKAYDYFYEYSTIRDSVINENTTRQIADAEAKFNLREKESQLEIQNTLLQLQESKLKNQRILVGSAVIVTFFLLVLLYFAYRNIQQRKSINRKLNELDKAKSQFFANITHELRTPLTLILAPLQGLLEKTNQKTVQEDLQLMQSNAKRLLNLTNEILELSKLDSGEIVVKETEIQLNDFCKRIFFAYQSLAQFRQINYFFRVHLDEHLRILADRGKIEIILNNLLSNAFKYSDSGGTIAMEIKQDNNSIKFIVSDTGKGIRREDLPKIFKRYYQSGKIDEVVSGGTGIGLALAREYALLMNGDITVKSSVGEGSTFIVTLPLIISAKEVPENQKISDIKIPYFETETPVKTSKAGKLPRILIVEDNHEMSKYLVSILADRYHCTPAPDGFEALKLLEKNHFNLIVSDIMMPNMDGFTFRKKVLQHDKWKFTPFILLTARTPVVDKEYGFKLGVDDYITKPFDPRELRARIQNLIKNKTVRDAFQAQVQSAEKLTKGVPAEQRWIEKAGKVVMDNLENSSFTASVLAGHLHYSQRQLERLLKQQTGFSPNAFIREIRLLEAYRMLENKQYRTVLEVGYSVGFDSPSYFSRKFTERFGIKPGKLIAFK